MSNKPTASECRFAVHIPTKSNDVPDFHLIKEQQHFADGSIKPNLRFIKNFKRPFYITRQNKRNHEQKKEYELIPNLLEISTTQSRLRDEISKALDKRWSNKPIKELSSSPYLYGSDISSTCIIKKLYKDKYPTAASAYTVAVFDIEIDVINGTKEAIMATIAFQDKTFTAIQKKFVDGFSCINDRLNVALNKYIGDYVTKRNLKAEFYIADDVVDVISACFKKAHEWMPDFLAIWNIDFDIPQVIRMLEENKIDPKDILCDPSVPSNLRICKYKQGPKKKVTASGKVTPISPASQWHVLTNTASFFTIDAMCCYKQIRSAEQEEPSYSLDAILNKELGIRKLKFVEADQYDGLKWHQVMQTEHKIEYIIYNIFDCISMLELDEKTKDLCFTLPSYARCSDFADFKSQPKRIADAFHFYCLEQGYVLGTVGKMIVEEDEYDEEGELVEAEKDILSLKGWIITLPAHLSILGKALLIEDENIRSGIRCFVYDSDEVAAYPTATSVNNVSRGTTKREIIDIVGIDEEVYRLQNINCLLGSVNSLEYATEMFHMPKPGDLLEMFLAN